MIVDPRLRYSLAVQAYTKVRELRRSWSNKNRPAAVEALYEQAKAVLDEAKKGIWNEEMSADVQQPEKCPACGADVDTQVYGFLEPCGHYLEPNGTKAIDTGSNRD